MVKHIQTICRLLPTNCLSEFDHFVRLALKLLTCLDFRANRNQSGNVSSVAVAKEEISKFICCSLQLKKTFMNAMIYVKHMIH